MMLTQEYLRGLEGEPHERLGRLCDERNIVAKFHDTEPLTILNYHQLDTPKTCPLGQECRGLVLRTDTWDVVARAFPRFFNLGEHEEHTSRFDWTDFSIAEKCDGSLMLLYRWRDTWRVNTRGSFATDEVYGSGSTWEELFYQGVDEQALDALNERYTYVFEFCSPWNKVVRSYPAVTVYLLTIVDRDTGFELSAEHCDEVAETIRCRRPARYQFTGPQEMRAWLDEQPDATFEGFVVRDRSGLRLKIKNARYVALHHLKGESGNLFHPRHLLPFVLSNEADELLTYFPECRERFFEVKTKVDEACAQMMHAWADARRIENQKEFALAIVPRTRFTSVLFEARKHGREPAEVWRESGDTIYKVLFKS